MNEVLYEETVLIKNFKSAKFKYNFINALSLISYSFTLFWIWIYLTSFAYVNTLVNILCFVIPEVIFISIGILIGKFKNRFYQEYDYAFISGTIRLAKVINSVKRKFLFEFNCSDIEMLGIYDSETYNKYEQMPGVNKQILTPNDTPAEGKDFYYLVVNLNAEKMLLIFECTKTLILNILKFSKKTILEKELRV